MLVALIAKLENVHVVQLSCCHNNLLPF